MVKHFSFLLILLVGSCLPVEAQGTTNGITSFFKEYLADGKFKSTYISNKMFETILKTKPDELDEETKAIFKDLTSLHALHSTKNNPDMQYKEAIPRVKSTEYTLLFSKADQVDMFSLFVKKNGEQISEMLLIARDHIDFVILSITGKIDLVKITRLAEILHFQGSEFLEQMNMSEEELKKTHIPGNRNN